MSVDESCPKKHLRERKVSLLEETTEEREEKYAACVSCVGAESAAQEPFSVRDRQRRGGLAQLHGAGPKCRENDMRYKGERWDRGRIAAALDSRRISHSVANASVCTFARNLPFHPNPCHDTAGNCVAVAPVLRLGAVASDYIVLQSHAFFAVKAFGNVCNSVTLGTFPVGRVRTTIGRRARNAPVEKYESALGLGLATQTQFH